MVDDLIVSPQYWGIFAVSMLAFGSIKYKPLDFKFFIVLPIAQRIAHTAMLSSNYVSSLVFSVLTGVFLVVGYTFVTQWIPTRSHAPMAPNSSNFTNNTVEARSYIIFAALYLATYYCIRFVLYPQFLYQLDLQERLQAQYDHRFLFILFLASAGAVTAITTRWVVNNGLNKWDKLLAAIVFMGYLTLGSKGTIAPLLMTYFGVSIYVGKSGMLRRALFVISLMVGIGGAALIFLFPTSSMSEIGNIILYRVVANSEEMEYLYYLNLQPNQYPFAGIGALFAPIAKLLGENIAYPPGVWLYGQRFGDWTGYGPNSGFVIEMFGNLNYFGLFIPLVIGGVIGYCEKRVTLYRVVLLSILPLAFAESLMFFVALTGHLGLMASAKLAALLLRKKEREGGEETHVSGSVPSNPIS